MRSGIGIGIGMVLWDSADRAGGRLSQPRLLGASSCPSIDVTARKPELPRTQSTRHHACPSDLHSRCHSRCSPGMTPNYSWS